MKDEKIKTAKALSDYKELNAGNQCLATTILQLYSALFINIANIQNAQHREKSE